MKRTLYLLLALAMMTAANAQIVVNSKFQPLSYEELVMAAQAKAIRDRQMQERFEMYQDLAYEQYNKGDYGGFVYYSEIALQTGWYNSKLYHDRGTAYERLHNYKKAKKEYKKAIKKGYYPATAALESCKRSEKYWKKNRR